MAANPSIPRPDAELLNRQWAGRPANEWYTFWQQLLQFVRENGGDAASIAALEGRVAALESEGATDAVIQGLYSVAVLGSLADGTVTLQLINDSDTPGNTYYYGTGPTGVKGWFTVASAFTADQPGIELVTGADGVTDIRPDDDLEAVEALGTTGLATRTAANTWTTRAVTAGAGISVSNGDGVAGAPTVAHGDTASVADLTSDNANGVVIQDVTITFDTFGHVQTATVGTVNLDARYLQATSVGNGLKIVSNVLSAGESGTEDATTVLRGDGVWANRIDGPFGVGPQTPNILGFTNAITLSSATNCGYEMASSRADADGVLIGAFTAIYLTNSVGHTRIADVQYSTDGTTANQRGGSVRFFTKSDGSTTFTGRWRVRSDGHFEPEADASYNLGSSTMRVLNEHIGGARLESGVVSPAQLVANTDNWSVTGLSTARTIRASTDASRNLTGIASPTANQLVRLCNVGGFNLVLIHDATSTAANRFLCPNNGSVTLRPNGWVDLWYDNTSSRWRVSGA